MNWWPPARSRRHLPQFDVSFGAIGIDVKFVEPTTPRTSARPSVRRPARCTARPSPTPRMNVARHREGGCHRARSRRAAGHRQHMASPTCAAPSSTGADHRGRNPPPSFWAATEPPSAGIIVGQRQVPRGRQVPRHHQPARLSRPEVAETFGPLAYIIKARVRAWRFSARGISPVQLVPDHPGHRGR